MQKGKNKEKEKERKKAAKKSHVNGIATQISVCMRHAFIAHMYCIVECIAKNIAFRVK